MINIYKVLVSFTTNILLSESVKLKVCHYKINQQVYDQFQKLS